MKRSRWLAILFCIGCAHHPQAPVVQISLVNQNRSVKIKGLDYAIISELSRDSIPGVWEYLVPVYRMPADTTLADYQPVQPGQYRLKDSAVVFSPDTPFVKNKTYFIRCYRFAGQNGIMSLLEKKKQLRYTPYTDLRFGF